MKPGDIVEIRKCTMPDSVGFRGELYNILQVFLANTNRGSMIDVLTAPPDKTCIGIIGDGASFLWTKESTFDVEIAVVQQ